MNETTEQLRCELIAKNKIGMQCQFVPFNLSRNCKDPKANWFKEPNWPSLNWRITLTVDGINTLVTDYGQGIGHIPGSVTMHQRLTLFSSNIIGEAIKTGRVPPHKKPWVAKPGKVPEPKIEDVLYSLLFDGSVYFDDLTFEQWCDDYGYDSDSRKAERMYNECINTGRVIQAKLGHEAVAELREAFSDY